MGQPETVETSNPSERSRRRRRRPQAARGASTRRTRQRLRVMYFSLAALWGFLAGSGAVLVGLSGAGRRVQLSGPALGLFGGASVVALIGGVVAAKAYRSASRRHG